MAKFLIEVAHESETIACARAVAILRDTGSHFLTHAEYGCRDGVHKAWMIVEAKDKDEIRRIVPPAYRDRTQVVQLNRFSVEEIDELLARHEGSAER
jgi:hypothetical protein